MSNNTPLNAMSGGDTVEDIDITGAGGAKRQVVTIGDRVGNSSDSIGGLAETAPASDTASSGLNGRLQRIAQRITSLIAIFTFTATRLLVRGEGRFIEAAFGTLTRPANVTAYSANDAVSNNATAGSVTAQTATVTDTNDDPISIERIRVSTSDTGPGVAGIAFQAWVFQSDPTASSGVGGGDNAAFSQKRAGLIGTFTGLFFPTSDGSYAFLTPDSGVRVIAKPVSGAATLFVVWKTLGPFTPSANSTTYVATLEGFQGRA